jgi:hypothetical protein
VCGVLRRRGAVRDAHARSRSATCEPSAQPEPEPELARPASTVALFRWIDDDCDRRRSLLPAWYALAPNRGTPTRRPAGPRGHSADAGVASSEMSSDASVRRPRLHAQHRFGGSTHELPRDAPLPRAAARALAVSQETSEAASWNSASLAPSFAPTSEASHGRSIP